MIKNANTIEQLLLICGNLEVLELVLLYTNNNKNKLNSVLLYHLFKQFQLRFSFSFELDVLFNFKFN